MISKTAKDLLKEQKAQDRDKLKEKNTTVLCKEVGIDLVRFEPNHVETDYEDEPINDCTVRAICKLLDKDWQEVYSMQIEESMKLQRLPNFCGCCESVLARFGYKKYKFEESEKFTTIAGFIMNHRKGKYFIVARNLGYGSHAIACINGTIYDKHFRMYDQFVSSQVSYVYYKED